MVRQNGSKLRWLSLLTVLICVQTATVGAETIETKYQYAVKAVCSLLSTFSDGALSQGIYRTLINIGNPTNEAVEIAVKPTVAGSLGAPSGGISGVIAKKGQLAPDGVISIGCGTIAGFFCPTTEGVCFDFAALDGFVKINSPVELDVVSIHTARPAEGELSIMDVETVEPRLITKEVEVVSADQGPILQPRMLLRGPLEAK